MQQDDQEESLGIMVGEEKPPQLPKREEKKQEPVAIPEGEEPKIFAITTQVGQERNVADLLVAKSKHKAAVFSVLAPQELRGYVFVEADDVQALERTLKLISYAKKMLTDPVPFAEIEHFLTPVSAVAKISEGDIVELVSGPFRGEKAKVTRIDDAKEEITVELFEAMVPIPVTVKGENVRVLKRHADK